MEQELRAPPAAPIPEAEFEGVVESVAGGVVSGWATYIGADPPACVIEVVGSGGLYLRTVANLYRADLNAAGKRQGLCAYDAVLPDSALSDGAGPAVPDAYAVLVAGLPHRLRPAGGTTTAPVQDWADLSGDPLSQDLVVHRCHQAMRGEGAPPELLERVRPPLPLTASGVCAAMEAVCRSVQAQPPIRSQEELVGLVHGVYRGVLRRDAEPRGLEIYCDALRRGMPLADLVGELMRTPEFLEVNRLQPRAAGGDGGAEEMHRLGDTLEKAMLTLAIAAAREKAPPRAMSALRDKARPAGTAKRTPR